MLTNGLLVTKNGGEFYPFSSQQTPEAMQDFQELLKTAEKQTVY